MLKPSVEGYRFEGFHLDPAQRRLMRGGASIDLNGRYLDALTLLVRDQGRLVSKDRFLQEVWRGVPVTDEALTQCIKTLRRELGDSASQPRFIETVPKHGYRFIAAVEQGDPAPASRPPVPAWRRVLSQTGDGAIGGGLAGLIGGVAYGLVGAIQAPDLDQAFSTLLVVVCLTIVLCVIGAAAVGLGVAGASLAFPRRGALGLVGGALGGLAVGGVVKFLGLDAFELLFGRAPGDITGGVEGLLLGAAVGGAVWIAGRAPRLSALSGALCGAAAGVLVALLGGHLMIGSLDLLAQGFPGSHLRLDALGRLLGESGLGPATRTVTAALEGGLFCGCVAGAIARGGGAVPPR